MTFTVQSSDLETDMQYQITDQDLKLTLSDYQRFSILYHKPFVADILYNAKIKNGE